MNQRKIIVYYPSKITGGAEYLLKNAIELLICDYEVKIYDIENGWLSSNIQDVEVVTLNNNLKYELDEDTVLITTANLVRKLDAVFSGEFKVLAWVVHPLNTIPQVPKLGGIQFKPFIKNILKKTILKEEYFRLNYLTEYLIDNNSLYVMDDACRDSIESYFGFSVKSYLPVTLPSTKLAMLNSVAIDFQDDINCVWLGRLDGQFKNPILIHTLKDINNFAKTCKNKIIFRIIGSGAGYNEVFEFAKTLEFLRIEFIEEARGEALKEILINSNIGFAMGTSALEIAACFVPTVLLDASYSRVSDEYKYQWLFDVKGYTLGRIIDASLDKTMGNMQTIGDVFNQLLYSHAELSLKSRKHVEVNHSKVVIDELLKEAVNATSSNFNEMLNQGLTKKPFWHLIRKIYVRLNN